jgi:hypothetical protein
MRIAGRVGALILGLIACAIALVTDILYSLMHRMSGALGSTNLDQTHGFIGFLLVLVGVLGSILALFSPVVAAVLLLIAGIGLLFVVKGWAIISLIFFVLAAYLAFRDRAPRQAQPRVPPQAQ